MNEPIYSSIFPPDDEETQQSVGVVQYHNWQFRESNSSIQSFDYSGATQVALVAPTPSIYEEQPFTQDIFQVINSPMLYGSIILPSLFWSAGLGLATVYFVVVSCLTTLSTWLILGMQQRLNRIRLIDLAVQLQAGRIVIIFIKSIILFNNFLYCVILLNTFGMCIQGMTELNNPSGWYSLRAIIAYGGIFITIFSFKLFYALRVAQFARNFAILGLALVIIGNSIQQGIEGTFQDIDALSFTSEAYKGMTKLPCLILIFSYMQQLSDEKYLRNKYENKEDYQHNKQTTLGSVIIFVYYYVIGVVSAIVFQQDLKLNNSNLISLISTDIVSVQNTNTILCLVSLFLLGIPALVQMLQYGFLSVLLLYSFWEPAGQMNRKKHYILIMLFQMSVIATSLLTCNIDILITVIGATSANFVTLLIPAVLHLMCDSKSLPRKIVAIGLIVASFALFMVPLITQLVCLKEGVHP